MFRSGREDVDDATTDGELPRCHHLADGCVSRTIQLFAECSNVELLVYSEKEAAGVDVLGGRQATGKRLRANDNDATLQRAKLV